MILYQKFKFGVFDVDGTLFDNMEVSADAFSETIKKFSLPEKETRKIYLETNGMNLNDQFRLVFDKYKITYDNTLVAKLNKDFFASRDNWEAWQNAPLFPGIDSLLKTLKENNAKLFISSGSNAREIAFRLEKAGISKYFDLIMGGEKIPKGAEHIGQFADFCGLTPQNFASGAFLLSDGPNDMALARSAGIYAIGITNTVNAAKLKSAGANMIISSIKEIMNL